MSFKGSPRNAGSTKKILFKEDSKERLKLDVSFGGGEDNNSYSINNDTTNPEYEPKIGYSQEANADDDSSSEYGHTGMISPKFCDINIKHFQAQNYKDKIEDLENKKYRNLFHTRRSIDESGSINNSSLE